MMSYPTVRSLFLCAPLLAALLAACSNQQPNLSGSSRQPVNFTGHWEMNYAQSDNIQARLNALVRELRKRDERRGATQGEVGGPAIAIGGSSNNNASVIGLAQMADMITQSALVTIDQDEEGIQVKREGNFALDCQFAGPDAYRVDSPLGRELCGWDGHQLVFTLLLPDGLSIRHRLTRSQDGLNLNIATTVVSDQVSFPFTLNRVYTLFEPGATGYRCEMTVTRGRVCTTEAE